MPEPALYFESLQSVAQRGEFRVGGQDRGVFGNGERGREGVGIGQCVVCLDLAACQKSASVSGTIWIGSRDISSRLCLATDHPCRLPIMYTTSPRLIWCMSTRHVPRVAE